MWGREVLPTFNQQARASLVHCPLLFPWMRYRVHGVPVHSARFLARSSHPNNNSLVRNLLWARPRKDSMACGVQKQLPQLCS